MIPSIKLSCSATVEVELVSHPYKKLLNAKDVFRDFSSIAYSWRVIALSPVFYLNMYYSLQGAGFCCQVEKDSWILCW